MTRRLLCPYRNNCIAYTVIEKAREDNPGVFSKGQDTITDLGKEGYICTALNSAYSEGLMPDEVSIEEDKHGCSFLELLNNSRGHR